MALTLVLVEKIEIRDGEQLQKKERANIGRGPKQKKNIIRRD
jgi:hypothetical protein